MTVSYVSRLHLAIRRKGTPALVGLDPRWDELPDDVRQRAADGYSDPQAAAAAAYEEFCVRIIDVVAPLVPAVKPQAAFFEQQGPDGCLALARVIRYARAAGLIVICDAKRGDIGTTAWAYAQAYLAGEDPRAAPWGADALTVNPYLGGDTLEPFVEVAQARGGGVYVLVRTSNRGARQFQDHAADGVKLYQAVAHTVEDHARRLAEAEGYACVGAVVGATYPAELASLREQMPHVPLLVPGYGSQGGTAADVAGAFDSQGLGALVNNSRGINFAFRSEPWASQFAPAEWESAVEAATRRMIADLAANTPARRLLSLPAAP